MTNAHEDPAFQAMCREHEIEGTAQVALCGAFWNRALASHTGEAEPRVTPAMVEHQQKMAADAESIGKNLDAIRGQLAATPVAPSEVVDKLLTDWMEASGRGFLTGSEREDLCQLIRAALALSNPAPVAAPAQGAYEKALDIRIGQGWQLGGNACPVLYTDTINGEQVRRDDLWLATTAGLKGAPAPASEAVEAERQHLRTQQAAAVMPKIGPLLDAWEGIDNDTKGTIREEAPELSKWLGSINRAMEGTPTSGDSVDAPVQQAETKGGA